jgi:hypothetical protein
MKVTFKLRLEGEEIFQWILEVWELRLQGQPVQRVQAVAFWDVLGRAWGEYAGRIMNCGGGRRGDERRWGRQGAREKMQAIEGLVGPHQVSDF